MQERAELKDRDKKYEAGNEIPEFLWILKIVVSAKGPVRAWRWARKSARQRRPRS